MARHYERRGRPVAAGLALAAVLWAGCGALAAEPEPPAGQEAPPAADLDTLLTPLPASGSQVGSDSVPDSPVPEKERKAVRALSNPVAGDPAAVSKGRLLFAANCQVCHGAAGEGPPANVGFSPPPRDFRSFAFQTARTDGEIFYGIRHGIEGTAMLPWDGRLTEREMWMLVAYIRSRTAAGP